MRKPAITVCVVYKASEIQTNLGGCVHSFFYLLPRPCPLKLNEKKISSTNQRKHHGKQCSSNKCNPPTVAQPPRFRIVIRENKFESINERVTDIRTNSS